MRIVDGATRLYVIIGDPIAQVKSPEGLTERFRAAGANALMLPVHVRTADFDEVVPALMRIANLDGLIATVPFKARVMPLADRVLESGRQVGAVNALRREQDGSWSADMFDGHGFVRGLEKNGHKVPGRRVLLIGAGGAGSALAFALAASGVAAIRIAEADPGRAERLAARLREFYPRLEVETGAPETRGRDLVVNASPVGMAPDDGMPVPLGRLDQGTVVADVIVKPEPTPFLRHGLACGCPVMGGGDMFEGQADELVRFFGIAK
jgi:shikimate dehydrogenase